VEIILLNSLFLSNNAELYDALGKNMLKS